MRNLELDQIGNATQQGLEAAFPELRVEVRYREPVVEIRVHQPSTGRRFGPLLLSVDHYEPPGKLVADAIREVRWWLEHP